MYKSILYILFIALLESCESTRQSDERTLYVSILPLRNLVSDIVGDDFDVRVLVPAGASPETFEPTPRQFIDLNRAEMIFNVGLIDFETSLLSKIENPKKIVNLSDGIELLAGSCSHAHGHRIGGQQEGKTAAPVQTAGQQAESSETDHCTTHGSHSEISGGNRGTGCGCEHAAPGTASDGCHDVACDANHGANRDDGHGIPGNNSGAASDGCRCDTHAGSEARAVAAHGIDPHIWTSPKALLQMAATAYSAIHRAYPDSVKYTANYERLRQQLEELDLRTAEKIARSGVEYFIIYHPALTYYARDYGLRQVAIEEDGKEPSARRLSQLIRDARKDGIRTIFYQSQFPASSVEIIARDINARSVEIDPLREDVVANIDSLTDLIVSE